MLILFGTEFSVHLKTKTMNNPDLNSYSSNSPSNTWEEYQKAYENYEIEYWCNKFGVSKEKLKQAISSVGMSVEAVEKYLKANGFVR